jgi:hypothetical protein
MQSQGGFLKPPAPLSNHYTDGSEHDAPCQHGTWSDPAYRIEQMLHGSVDGNYSR